MNYFICALTYVKKDMDKSRFRELEYSSDNGKYFGCQTNEATTKYLIDKLSNDGELFDKFLLLVTDECQNIEVPVLDDRTTFAYYSDVIKGYLREKINNSKLLSDEIENRFGSIGEYLENAFIPISVSENMSRAIVDCVDVESRNKIYLDFTGGSRLSCLISFLLVKILETTSSEVRQIVYGDILSGSPKISDCTFHYDMLKVIENLARANGNSKEMLSELKKLNLIDDLDDSEFEELENLEIKAEDTLKKSSQEDIDKEKKQIDSLISSKEGLTKAVANEAAKRIIEKKKVSGYTKLSCKNTKDLIKDFNESIMELLIDSKVVVSDIENGGPQKVKETVLNSIKANDSYYCNVDKKRGLVFVLSNWMKELQKNEALNPIKYYYEKSGVTNYRWFRPQYPKKLNIDKTRMFLEYIDSKKINIKEANVSDLFLNISQYQLVYYNLGFPFMCMGLGGDDKCYPEIAEYYNEKVKSFMKKLSELKMNDLASYKNELKRFNDENEIEKEIPYLMKVKEWSANDDLFDSEESKEEFIRKLCERLEKVRPYRNAIAHNLKNQYSDPKEQKAISEEIKCWVEEYQEIFENKREEK